MFDLVEVTKIKPRSLLSAEINKTKVYDFYMLKGVKNAPF